MRLKGAILIGSFLITFMGVGQNISFLKSYGNSGYDYARDIKQDVDTGYVVTGSSSSFSNDNGDAYILKIDSLGNKKWSHNYGGQGSDWGEAIEITNDSTYVVCGYTNSFGNGGYDVYLIRVDTGGSVLWEKTYGGADWDKGYSIKQLPDSGFVMVGETYSFGDGILHGYAIRVDKNGDTLWTYVMSNAESYFRDVAFVNDSLVICGGINDGTPGSFDGLIVKMDLNANVDWTQTPGQGYNDYFNAVYVDGGFYNFGGVRSYNYPTEKSNFWIYKIEDNGTLVYDVTYPNFSPGEEGVNDLVVRSFDQDVYLAAYTSTFGFQVDGKLDIFTTKMTSTNVFLASKTYGEKGDDIAWAVDHCYDYGVVFVFDTKKYSTGGNNIMVLKLDYTWTYPDQFTDITYEDITSSIEESEIENTDLKIYPNPAHNSLNFSREIKGQIRIMTMDGKEVFSQSNPSTTINIQDLSKGMYVLVIQEEGNLYRTTFLKK